MLQRLLGSELVGKLRDLVFESAVLLFNLHGSGLEFGEFFVKVDVIYGLGDLEHFFKVVNNSHSRNSLREASTLKANFLVNLLGGIFSVGGMK